MLLDTKYGIRPVGTVTGVLTDTLATPFMAPMDLMAGRHSGVRTQAHFANAPVRPASERFDKLPCC